MKSLNDFDWRGKIAVTRADLNAPLTAGGEVADDTRLTAAAQTARFVLDGGGGVVMLSHLGRPTEGAVDERLSLRRVADAFAGVLGHPVRFCPDIDAARPAPGEAVMLENTRFNVGEKANDIGLARRYAALGDVFVMDAFASAHRTEASVEAIARAGGIPVCAGALLAAELENIGRVTRDIKRPLVGVFGGAKISTKLALLKRMAALCDVMLVGGGMANTLLLARGVEIGASLAQRDMLDAARAVLAAGGEKLRLPSDVIVGAAGSPESQNTAADDSQNTAARCVSLDAVGATDAILDIGAQTQRDWADEIAAAKTIIWNGPVGLFENPAYAAGTFALARAIARGAAYSLIGGADTIAAARAAGGDILPALAQTGYVSTGGGALLEFLAGENLPGIAALQGAGDV